MRGRDEKGASSGKGVRERKRRGVRGRRSFGKEKAAKRIREATNHGAVVWGSWK